MYRISERTLKYSQINFQIFCSQTNEPEMSSAYKTIEEGNEQ